MKVTLTGNPLSTGSIYRSYGSRTYLTNKAKELKDDYIWQAREQWHDKPLQGNLEATVILYFGDKRCRDWDNFHKLSCDALNGIVWEDDEQLYDVRVLKQYDKKNPRTEIIIAL